MTRYKHVVEIGAGDSVSSQGLAASPYADKVTLYEPNRILWTDLARAALSMSNVKVINAAVWSPTPTTLLYHLGYASFVHGAPSFLATSVEPGYEEWWAQLGKTVPAVSVSDAISSDTDCLVLTANGAELLILQQMLARPSLIRIKHYCHTAPQYDERNKVWGWLQGQGYGGGILESNQHATFFHTEWKLKP